MRRNGATAPGAAGEALAPLTAFLSRLRLLLWGARAGEGALRAFGVAAVVLVLDTLVGERLAVPPWVAFAAAAAGSAALLAALALLLLRLRPPGQAEAALRVQRAVPELRNDLETGLELLPAALRGQGAAAASRELLAALVARTGTELAPRSPWSLVPRAGLRRAALFLAVAALPVAVLSASGPGIPGTAVRALLDPRVYWPLGRITIETEPGDVRLARGAPLAVRVRVRGGRPAAVLLRTEEAGRPVALVGMTREPDGSWSWRFPAVAADFRYRALAGADGGAWHQVHVIDPPAAGSFEVRYTYPAYSGLGTRLATGGADLEALPGTTAAISFATTRPIAAGTLAAGESRIAVVAQGEGRYGATLYLGGARSYRVELEDADGIGNGGGPEYDIRYLPDGPPEAQIVNPTGTVEGDPGGAVLVAWRAADDFGLTRLELVSRLGGRERRLAAGGSEAGRAAGGEREVDLGALEPQPGDVITIVLEATDNDTIGGPKTVASAPLAVAIADPRERREEAREEMERLADDLLELLAEELELEAAYEELREAAERDWERFPWEEARRAAERQDKAAAAARRAANRVSALTAELERSPDTGEETLLQADTISAGLEQLRERRLGPMDELARTLSPEESGRAETAEKTSWLASTAEEAARAAEQLALMADEMRRESRMADAGRSALEMADAEERILDGLERLSPGERAEAEEILRELEELERGLHELAKTLAEDAGELPEEFLNSDALRQLDLGEVLDALGQVRERLSRGDIEGARQAARELASRMQQLRAALQQAGDQFDRKMAQALGKMRGETLPELDRILAEQRELLGRSEALAREARAGQASPAAESPAGSVPPASGEEGASTPGTGLTPAQRRRSEELAAAQRALRERTDRAAADLGALRSALHFIPAEAGSGVARAATHMGEAGDALALPAPGDAPDPQRAAIAELSRAGESAREALDALARMQGARSGSGMGGLQPMLPGGRQGARAGGSSPTRGWRSGGRRGVDVRSVPIPGRRDWRPPSLFREEIIRSLRDGYPAQYEERIRDYFRRIAQ